MISKSLVYITVYMERKTRLVNNDFNWVRNALFLYPKVQKISELRNKKTGYFQPNFLINRQKMYCFI